MKGERFLKRVAAAVCALIIAGVLPRPVFAANSIIHEGVSEEANADGTYTYAVKNSGARAVLSVKNGGSASSVTLTALGGAMIYNGGALLKGTQADATKHVFSVGGAYSITVMSLPDAVGDRHYGTLTFVVLGQGEGRVITGPQTTAHLVILSTGETYSVNVADGEKTQSTVSASAQQLTITITKDGGREKTLASGEVLREAGEYVMRFYRANADKPADSIRFTITATTLAIEDKARLEAGSPVDQSRVMDLNDGQGVLAVTPPTTRTTSAADDPDAPIILPDPEGNGAASIPAPSAAPPSGGATPGGNTPGAGTTPGGSTPGAGTTPGETPPGGFAPPAESTAASGSPAPSAAPASPGGAVSPPSAPEPSGDMEDGMPVVSIAPEPAYHPDYGIYEYGLGDTYYYSNVENGSIGQSAAEFRFPKGVRVEASLDGEPIRAADGKFDKPGAYVLEISKESAGAVYKSTVHFLLLGDESGSVLPPAIGDPALDLDQKYTFGGPSPSATIPAPSESGEPVAVDEEPMPDVTEITGVPAPPNTDTEPLFGAGAFTGLNEEYDKERLMFRETTVDGYSFYGSVPNGCFVNEPVRLAFGQGALPQMEFWFNGEQAQYIPGAALSAPGVYTFALTDMSMTSQTQGLPMPRYSFRIIGAAVNDVEVFNAPWGYRLEAFSLNGAPASHGQTYALLSSDGEYEFICEPEDPAAPPIALTTRVDTKAPVIKIEGDGSGRATVNIVGDGSATAAMYKDNKQIAFSGEVTSPGNYRVVASDEAGNAGEASFSVAYRVDLAGVAVIILAVLVLGGGGAGVFLMRRKTQVR